MTAMTAMTAKAAQTQNKATFLSQGRNQK
jgi:hypothetical protein